MLCSVRSKGLNSSYWKAAVLLGNRAFSVKGGGNSSINREEQALYRRVQVDYVKYH